MMFFFNDTATTEIYTLSLHDALPISRRRLRLAVQAGGLRRQRRVVQLRPGARADADRQHRLVPRDQWLDVGARAHAHEPALADRKSTRLNSSHANISYAVFCLKKKKI